MTRNDLRNASKLLNRAIVYANGRICCESSNSSVWDSTCLATGMGKVGRCGVHLQNLVLKVKIEGKELMDEGSLSSRSVGGVGTRRGDGAARGICNIVKGCVAAHGG